MKQDDHDLLIAVSTKLDDLTRQMRELRDGTVVRISALEKDKADRTEVQALQKRVNEDIETRVRDLENDAAGITTGWRIAFSILTLVVAVIGYFVIYR